MTATQVQHQLRKRGIEPPTATIDPTETATLQEKAARRDAFEAELANYDHTDDTEEN